MNNSLYGTSYIVAIYLLRADVVAQSCPPLHHPHGRKLYFPQHIRVHALHARSHTHCLRFIHWLAAIARHSSGQLAADARELLTITPTAPPPAPLQVSPSPCQAAPLSHEDATSMSFLKTHNPFCLPVGTFSYTSARCPIATSAHTNTNPRKQCRLD